MPSDQEFKNVAERVEQIEGALAQVIKELGEAFDLIRGIAETNKSLANSVTNLANSVRDYTAQQQKAP